MEPIDHILNDMTVLLSKHYGLIKTLNFSLFPNETHETYPWPRYFEELDLVSISSPRIGEQNLTWFDVYNFQPGDEIHVTFESSCDGDWIYEKSITRYLSRTDYPNSIVYGTEVESNKSILHNGEGPTYYYHDFKSETVESNPNFDKLPGEPIFDEENLAWTHRMKIGSNITKTKISEYDYLMPISDTCWSIACCWDGCFPNEEYYKGLGGPYYWCESFFCMGETERKLVYYKKGEQIWGNPVIITAIDTKKEINPVNIFPNPTKDQIKIDIFQSNLPCTFEIIDLGGKILLNTYLVNEHTLLNLEQYNTNYYLYRVTKNNEIIDIGNLIIQ